jgi:D-glycero-D-manno-heptose 1,7-bisphosphate phosphatase
MPARPAVFLDRDGVINRTFIRAGISVPPARLEDFRLLPGVVAACWRLRNAGFALFVVTNQPDVARGTTPRETVEAINDLVSQRLPIEEVLTCFHDDADHCDCRKPKPGLILEAARRYDLDLASSYLIGDRWSDIVAGQSAGCKSILIDTPFSGRGRCQPDALAEDLPGAAGWIAAQFLKGAA